MARLELRSYLCFGLLIIHSNYVYVSPNVLVLLYFSVPLRLPSLRFHAAATLFGLDCYATVSSISLESSSYYSSGMKYSSVITVLSGTWGI
jgi:hypothetical protein